MEIFPLDIWNIITKLLIFDLKSLLNLKLCKKFFDDNILITNLFDINNKFLSELTIDVLSQIKYMNVVKLNVSYNPKITNVSFMKKLKILNADGSSGIDQKDIEGLDLVELIAYNNQKITNVSFMKNLKKLDASGNCGIDAKGIEGLDLVELYFV